MSDSRRLAAYVDIWRDACDRMVALARALPEEHWHRPTDLPGWDVIDNVAHTCHLEAVLAGAPEETVAVPEGLPHVRSLMGVYTEQGVIARRGRSASTLADELEHAVATRHDALRADPPADGKARPAYAPGGVDWDTGRLLASRPLDVWMHVQDINRAIGRRADYDAPAAAHTIGVLGAGLPRVLAKGAGAPARSSVAIEMPGHRFAAEVGDDGRGRPRERADTDCTISLSREAFVVLAGGRRRPAQVTYDVVGDRDLAEAVLDHLALTP